MKGMRKIRFESDLVKPQISKLELYYFIFLTFSWTYVLLNINENTYWYIIPIHLTLMVILLFIEDEIERDLKRKYGFNK